MSKSWRESDDSLRYRKRQSIDDWQRELDEELAEMEQDCE